MKREESAMPSSLADMATLGKLLEEHRPKLLAMVQRRMDPALTVRIDPEEILSEAFLEARRKWDRFKEQAALTPYAWLYRIVRDCLIEAWRRETRARRDLRQVMPLPGRSSIQLGLGLVNPGTSPSDAAARKELQEQMRQALDLLPDSYREILWMRYFDELSFKEVAMVLDVKANTAAVRCIRAQERLKELWQQLHQDKGLQS